ncbi:MAG: tRNA (adenosine(37)-N6)-threonylcarbamoyltransferase complex dimerization subunit type 1 TsaB [Bryobacteraceae bacterium]|nr:tRNA (adenosine(37)-N6)-threonylcarbamoyltransferase complex dimerization subunit type 1 TsaB [Bryobacteraceae bacterium]
MRLLSIDTTSPHGGLALLDDGTLVEEVALNEPDGYSPVIFGAIESALERHGWTLDSIDAFAAASGPGSFTGVRVGLSAVKGLAEALGRPAFGVSNLQAVASFGTTPIRAPWLDARRGEIYGGVFDSELRALAPETVGPRELWEATLPLEAEIVAGDGLSLAAAVVRIAAHRYRLGDRPDPATLDANYLRRSDAEIFSKPLH